MTVAFPFMLLLMALGMLVGFGTAALISIRLGEKRKPEAEQVLGNATVLLLVAATLSTALGLLWLDPLLRFFGANDSVLPYAHAYFSVIALGSVFQIVSFGLNSMIRGEGNPKIAMLTMLISVSAQRGAGADLPLRFPLGHEGGGAGHRCRPGRRERPGCWPISSPASSLLRSAPATSACKGRSAAGCWPSVPPPSPCKSPMSGPKRHQQPALASKAAAKAALWPSPRGALSTACSC